MVCAIMWGGDQALSAVHHQVATEMLQPLTSKFKPKKEKKINYKQAKTMNKRVINTNLLWKCSKILEQRFIFSTVNSFYLLSLAQRRSSDWKSKN